MLWPGRRGASWQGSIDTGGVRVVEYLRTCLPPSWAVSGSDYRIEEMTEKIVVGVRLEVVTHSE